MMRLSAFMVAAVMLTGSAHAVTCFTLLAPDGSVARQSSRSPVDMTKSISDEVASKFPGHHLVFGPSDSCQEIGPEPIERAVAIRGAAPASRSAAPAELFSGYQASVLDGSDLMSSGAPSAGLYPDARSYSGSSRAGGGSGSAGTDVSVRGYTRRDGVYVAPHTRSAPLR